MLLCKMLSLFIFFYFFLNLIINASTNKTNRHHIVEILLKVALNMATLTLTIVINERFTMILNLYHALYIKFYIKYSDQVRVRVMVFNATFKNISGISWRSRVCSVVRVSQF